MQASLLPIHQGFEYLRREAEEAHLAGDGVRVLHLCQIVFDYLQRQLKLNALNDLAIEDVRWSLSLALYWTFREYELSSIHDLLKKLPCRDPSQCDRRVLSHVLTNLRDPFSFQPIEDLLTLPDAWLSSRSTERADVALLTLAVEQTWINAPYGRTWQHLAATWSERSERTSALTQSLNELLVRLRFQTYLTFGKWPEGCGIANIPPDVPPLAEAYSLYVRCEWAALDQCLRTLVPRIRAEDPGYGPLFRLIHFARYYRPGGDSQFLALSRYESWVSHEPRQVHGSFRERAFLGHALRLARSQGVGDGDNALSAFRLSLLAELTALRAWNLAAWHDAVGDQSQIAIELANSKVTCDKGYFAKTGIIKAVRALRANENDARFLGAVERLDKSNIRDREELVADLLSVQPIEWGDAWTALKALCDSIPENSLPDVAKWSVQLETTDVRFRMQRITWLGFWGDILGYVPDTSELISILAPALIHVCGIPQAWSETEKALHEALARGSLDIATEMGSVLASQNANGSFGSQQWGMLYDACANRPELRERFLPWLRTAAEGDALYQHYIMRMKAGFPRKPIDDQSLRDYLITESTRLAERTKRSDTDTISFAPMPAAPPFRLTLWTDTQIPFVADLLSAIESKNGIPREKSGLLQILAAIVETATKGILDLIGMHVVSWFSQGLSSYDPFSRHRNPFSQIVVLGGAPEEIERGLWWLGYALVKRDLQIVNEKLTDETVKGAMSPNVIDLAFATMARLALTAPTPERLMGLAMTGLNPGLTADDTSPMIGRLVHTFASLLDGDDFSIAKRGDSDAARALLDYWCNRLPLLGESLSVDVRIAVARSLSIWSRLPASYSWMTFPAPLAKCLDALKSDARARVRHGARQQRESESEIA